MSTYCLNDSITTSFSWPSSPTFPMSMAASLPTTWKTIAGSCISFSLFWRQFPMSLCHVGIVVCSHAAVSRGRLFCYHSKTWRNLVADAPRTLPMLVCFASCCHANPTQDFSPSEMSKPFSPIPSCVRHVFCTLFIGD